MRNKYSLRDQVIEITTDYLGPASQRFVDRQITAHLGKAPEELKRSDIPKLIAWMEAVVSLLTHDDEIVKEYINKLTNLAGSTQRS
ncbi:MAG TPA: hypothetical protein VFK11_02840 [Candidatus Saccharimonadales bacterium]|nr:hypothetical protein [Candidatus Saccharimonadales bacterium]